MSGDPKTWRDGVRVHPLANTFPMMSDGELRELAEDIKKNGQREPVLFATIDGKEVIDGRNRAAACFLIGQAFLTERVGSGLTEEAIEALIVSKNVHRRHLTPEQRAKALHDLIKADPKKSDRAIAKKAEVSPTTVGKARAELSKRGQLKKDTSRIGQDGKTRKVPAKKAAKPLKKVEDTEQQKVPDATAAGPNAAKVEVGNAAEPADDSAAQRKAAVSEGNTAGLDEFKTYSSQMLSTFDKVDLAEARNHVERECSKYAAALRSGAA